MTPEQFRDAIKNPEAELARIATHLDLLETKAANASGITAWADDVALAYETAVIPHRR